MKIKEEVVKLFKESQNVQLLTSTDLKQTIPGLWDKLSKVYDNFVKDYKVQDLLDKIVLFYKSLQDQNIFVCQLYTSEFVYKIIYSKKSNYVGLVSIYRKSIPGQYWLRTNQMWSGSLEQGTIQIIFDYILQNEFITISNQIFEKEEGKNE